jgi:FKBP-type peptidyl-prolyl cis-trans isomerase SlyD
MESVQLGKRVAVKYRMRTHLVDGTVKDHPEDEMSFIFGVDRQVSSLEKAMEDCRVGDRLSITIPAREIYGEYDPSLTKEIPRKGLIKQRLQEGQYYRQMKQGCLVSFKVLELKPHTVVADFNEPLAGISVSMDLEILALKDASREEIDAAWDAQVKKSIGCG